MTWFEKNALFEYKCRRCGAIYTTLRCNNIKAIKLLAEIIINKIKGIRGLRIYYHHHCEDGGHGLSDLIGFKKEEG